MPDDDGVVQQRDRGRSARSESRVGRRRRLVPIGRWRAELGPGELAAAPACRRTRTSISTRITFHPQYDGDSNQIALIGNDGGIFRTTQCARGDVERPARARAPAAQPIQVAWTSLNRGYGVTQFYHGTPFPDGTQYLAGAQDNGTLLGSDAAGPDGWRPVFGGDGGFSAVHPTQTSTWLMEFQWANLGRTTNGGNTFTQSRTGLDPIVASNARARTAITCSSRRSRTIRSPNASGWAAISCIAGRNFGLTLEQGAELARCPTAAASARSRSRRAPTRIVIAGTDQGHILRTDERHADAVGRDHVHGHAAAQGWVTSIAFDPRSRQRVYATYGNFGGAHVFRSIDSGATWQSLDGSGSTGLPDIPVHSIVVDPDDSQRLYLGTDLGVMVSIDGGQHVDDRRDRIRAGRDDVAVADSHAGRTETVVRVHAWPRGVACATALRISSPRSCAFRSPTP